MTTKKTKVPTTTATPKPAIDREAFDRVLDLYAEEARLTGRLSTVIEGLELMEADAKAEVATLQKEMLFLKDAAKVAEGLREELRDAREDARANEREIERQQREIVSLRNPVTNQALELERKIEIPHGTADEVRRWLFQARDMGFVSRNKISLIREIRGASGLGLKEAKDLADELFWPPGYVGPMVATHVLDILNGSDSVPAYDRNGTLGTDSTGPR